MGDIMEKKYQYLLYILAFMGLFFIAMYLPTNNASEKLSERVSIELKVDFPGDYNDIQRYLVVNKGITAFEVLDQNEEVKYTDFPGVGYYVTSINDIEEDLDKQTFWMFYVNGKQAEVGASSYVIDTPTTIEFRYEESSW